MFNALRFHEREDHREQPCITERINFIAWLAHCLGLRPEMIGAVADQLAAYNRDCKSPDCHETLPQSGLKE